MPLAWFHEDTPKWDTGKAEVVGKTPAGVFEWSPPGLGELVPGEWFRVATQARTDPGLNPGPKPAGSADIR